MAINNPHVGYVLIALHPKMNWTASIASNLGHSCLQRIKILEVSSQAKNSEPLTKCSDSI